jgi:hypothetical protein
VYVDADTHTHIHVPPQRIIMKKVTNRADADTHTHAYTLAKYLECKWLQCMSRLVADSTESSNDSMFIVMPPAHSNVRYIIFKAQRIEPILHAETNPAGPGSKSVLFK